MNRRAFLTGLIAAPAVIRVAPLMRITPWSQFMTIRKITGTGPNICEEFFAQIDWEEVTRLYEKNFIYGNDDPQFEPVRFHGLTRVAVNG